MSVGQLSVTQGDGLFEQTVTASRASRGVSPKNVFSERTGAAPR